MTNAQAARELCAEVPIRLQPIRVADIDRLQLFRDLMAHKPSSMSLAIAVGTLGQHVTAYVLRNALETAIWPGRLDFDACLREAYKVIQCQAGFGDGSQCQLSSLPGEDFCLGHCR